MLIDDSTFDHTVVLQILHIEQELVAALMDSNISNIYKSKALALFALYNKATSHNFENTSFINYCVSAVICNKTSEVDLTIIPSFDPSNWLAYVRLETIKLWARRLLNKELPTANNLRTQQKQYEYPYLITANHKHHKALELISLYHLAAGAEFYNTDHLEAVKSFLDYHTTANLLILLKPILNRL